MLYAIECLLDGSISSNMKESLSWSVGLWSSLFTAGTFISLPVSLQMVANVNWNYRSAKLIEICIGHNVMAVLPGCYHSYYHSQTYNLKTQLPFYIFRDIY